MTDSPQGTSWVPGSRCTWGAAGLGGRPATSRVEVSHRPITAQCIGSFARTATRSERKVWSDLLTQCNRPARPCLVKQCNRHPDLQKHNGARQEPGLATDAQSSSCLRVVQTTMKCDESPSPVPG